MYREGHVGAALVAYTPVGVGAVLVGVPGLAALGAVVSVALASLPDYDLRVPFVSHRGITHTVWFAAVVGAVLGGVGVLASGPATWPTPVLAVFGATVGVVVVGSHVAADALTPMGVEPFAPLSDANYSLSLVTADDTLANWGLLAGGVLTATATAALLVRFGLLAG